MARLTEIHSSGVKKKWTSTDWTQDNTTLGYAQNPRVTETNIYDDAGNRRRTTIDYSPPQYAQFSLPYIVTEYAADGATALRRSYTDYNLDSAYTSRRIIGLVSARHLFDADWALKSKTTYSYDWDWAGDMFQDVPGGVQVTNHDRTNYGPSFITGRGNLSQMARYDVNDPNNANNTSAETKWRVNLTGAVLMERDHLWHQTFFAYADSFSDNVNRNTFAYPTTVTDADGYSSAAQYNYDFGAVTRTHAPTSGTGGGITYLEVVREYDPHGRLERATNLTNNAYTRFVYETNANYVHSYQTIVDLTVANEFHSWQVMDGAGRVRASASDHPGSTGGYQGQYVIYDVMGRVSHQSNPTEMNGSWVPTGDDSVWRNTIQAYDWQGRPTQTTNTDGSTRVVSYGGCGCAGGELTTVQDEHGRQRRFTKDALGRLATVQEMMWNSGNVYAMTTYSYNARDQITQSNQAGQIRSFGYDGRGRLQTRITPEQGTTTYAYNSDDTTESVIDARGVITTFGYNGRHLVTGITYNVAGDPTGQTTTTPNISFAYDAAGNRTSMSDGLGSVGYNYNDLAQLTSETRNFNGVGTPFTLTYGYNLAGELESFTNPWGAQVGYGYDKAGRLTNVSGAGYAGVSNYAAGLSYRAFGAIKGMSYGNGRSLSTGYDGRLRPTTWNVANVLGYNYGYQGFYQENTGRVVYTQNISSGGGATNGGPDSTLDRSYEYDHVGRLIVSHSGAEARAHVINGQWGTLDGPYSQGYDYDQWGNMTRRFGWGGEMLGPIDATIPYSYPNGRNQRNGSIYDAAGNVTNDGGQTFQYDATGQQTFASVGGGWGAAPTYQDNPLNPPNQPKTDVKAAHITDLRTAINSLRNRLGLPNYSWQYSATTNDFISANPIIEMRTALDEALGAGSYAPGLASGQPVKAVHIQELRDRVTTAWNAYSAAGISQFYDGNGLRVKKTETGATTWYLRSTVLGGQVIAELNPWGSWSRGYVYAGSNLLAVQQGGVYWMHEDPVTKSKRVTDSAGAVVSTIETDPWGADTNRSSGAAFQKKFTSYDRDGNGSDEAMFRRFNRWWSRFDQPDPYDGSYNLGDPQSFNRYSYVKNDPVNFADPTGLAWVCSILDNGERICFDDAEAVTVYDGGRDPFSSDPFFNRGLTPGGNRVEPLFMPVLPPTGGAPPGGVTLVPPQNPAPTPPTGDCARFADRVEQIASGHDDVRGFVNELARTFIGVISADVNVMRENANNSVGERFTSTGFRANLFDNIGDNQARHFMGGLIAGYNLGGTPGALVMNHNEDSQADLRVNGISIPLGARLTNPRREEIVDRGDRGGWRRIAATSGFKALADAIRNQVCAR